LNRQTKRSALLALLLLCGAEATAAKTGEVTGRVVDESGVGLAEAVVFVQELPPGAKRPDVPHSAVMDQVNKEFVPHVVVVPTGGEARFPNHDQIHHHVYSLSRTKTFEIPLYKGETAPPVQFDKPGAVKVGCNIHDWMSGVILVVPTPYFTTTDESGAFTLRDVPAGTYTIAAWHERSRTPVASASQTVTVGDGATPATFTLDAAPSRSRPTRYRSYE
jgi:plastocyanin